MSIHEQARAEAEKRWPTPDHRASQEEYDSAIASQGAFEDGAEWAATRTRVVTTVTELAALPHDYATVVRDSLGQVWQRSRNAWDCLSEDGTDGLYPSSALALPARVLYDPEENR